MPALAFGLGIGFQRGPSGGGGVSPPVADPLIWLDANRESFANNDSVGQFTDWSGNGHHFAATGTERPLFKTNRINGLPTVQADGVNDGMTLASLQACTGWSLFVVGRLVADTGGVNLISIDDYDPDGIYVLFQYAGASTVNINGNAGTVNQASCVAGTAYAWAVTGDASVATIRSSDDVGGSNSADYSKLEAPMRLFRRGDGQYANFEISELLFYGTKLDTTDRTTVWTYLHDRYAVGNPATP